jgi:hypothetical protein
VIGGEVVAAGEQEGIDAGEKIPRQGATLQWQVDGKTAGCLDRSCIGEVAVQILALGAPATACIQA